MGTRFSSGRWFMLGVAFAVSGSPMTECHAQPFHSFYKLTSPPGIDLLRARDLQIAFDQTTGSNVYVAAHPEGIVSRFKPNGNVVGMWRYAAQQKDTMGNCTPVEIGIRIDSIEQTSDGGYIAAFDTSGLLAAGNSDYSAGLLRLKPSGAPLWAYLYRRPDGYIDQIHKCQPGLVVRQTRNSGGATTGFVLCFGSNEQLLECGVLMRTNLNGDLLSYTRVKPNPGQDLAFTDVEPTSTGFVVSGSLQTESQYDPVLARFNSSGSLVAVHRYTHFTPFTGTSNALGHALTTVDGGQLIMSIGVNALPDGHAGLMRITPTGGIVWSNSWQTGASGGYQAIQYQNVPGVGGRVAIAGPCEVGWGSPSFALVCDPLTGVAVKIAAFDVAGSTTWRRAFDAIAPRLDSTGWALSGSGQHFPTYGYGEILLTTDVGLTQSCPQPLSPTSGAITTMTPIELGTSTDAGRYKVCVVQYTDPTVIRINACGQ